MIKSTPFPKVISKILNIKWTMGFTFFVFEGIQQHLTYWNAPTPSLQSGPATFGWLGVTARSDV